MFPEERFIVEYSVEIELPEGVSAPTSQELEYAISGGCVIPRDDVHVERAT